jgi:hypothetical protein
MPTDDTRFVELYERYYGAILAYCRRRTAADRAEDAVADTFLTAWRRIDDLPGATTFSLGCTELHTRSWATSGAASREVHVSGPKWSRWVSIRARNQKNSW